MKRIKPKHFTIDPKVLNALKKTAEKVQQEYHSPLRGHHPYEGQTTFGEWFIRYGNPSFNFINFKSKFGKNPNHPWSDKIDMGDFKEIPFYHECYNIKDDLTTAQKMMVTIFLFNFENAEDIHSRSK